MKIKKDIGQEIIDKLEKLNKRLDEKILKQDGGKELTNTFIS